MTALAPVRADAMRGLQAPDMPGVKAVITSTGLFPADMMDDMAEPWLRGDMDGHHWTVLDRSGQVIGLTYAAPERMTDGTWNLLLIAIHADHQGAGHGRTLLAHLEAGLAAQGARVLLVEISGVPDFARVRSFYSHRGFRQEAVIHDFYQAGEDKVVFWKALARPAA